MWRRIVRLLSLGRRVSLDTRANAELTVPLLLCAGGVAAVSMTLPALFDSADRAAQTFRRQVVILERGASPSGEGNARGAGWQVRVDQNGVSASGPIGRSGRATIEVYPKGDRAGGGDLTHPEAPKPITNPLPDLIVND